MYFSWNKPVQADHTLENHQTHRRELIKQRGMIIDKLKLLDNTFENAQFTQHLINLWVIDGFVQHNFKLTVLMEIAARFKKINCVPEGYHYADLWVSNKKPDFMEYLDKRKLDKQ